MENLTVCPSTLSKGYTTYCDKARRELFDGREVSHVLPYLCPDSEDTIKEMRDGSGRISLSGVQEKMAAIVKDGSLVLSQKNEQSTHIIKPIPTAMHLFHKDFMPANEHLSMQIASQIYKIQTASNGIAFWKDGSQAYVTRRFDVNTDGTKNAMEDFASLAGLTRANGGSDYKYCNLSYEECSEIIRKNVTAGPVEILKFFRIIIFNYLISNDDAHLKNFSIIEKTKGEYTLSPAYDLINTFIHLGMPRVFALDKGLFKEGMRLTDTHSISRTDFEEFGERLGLNSRIVKRELERFCDDYAGMRELVDNSFLSDTLKRDYLLSFNYRKSVLKG